MKNKPERPGGFPKTLTEGSAQVRLYWQPNPKKRLDKSTGKLVKTGEFSNLYTLAYYEPSQVKNSVTGEVTTVQKRVLHKFAELKKAESEAGRVLNRLANLDGEALKLKGSDRLAYVDAMRILREWQPDAKLALVVNDYVAAMKLLPPGSTLQQAVADYAKGHPINIPCKSVMQTIARANRVFPGKHSGMIVDYANVFASLERALAIYGAGKGGNNPVQNKQKLVEDLRRAISEATAFCAKRQVILPAIEQLAAGSMPRLQKLADAVDALISPDPLRREFLGHERIVGTLYGAVKPDPSALEFAGRVATLTAIAEAIRTKLNPTPADITAVMGDIAKLLDASITGVDMPAKPAPVMDLSKIDFEALRSRFKESKHKHTNLEVLKAAIRAQLEKLIRLNKTRADFAEKFEELIESYNNGSRNIEELFEELVKLSRGLSEEQQRHVRESMTEEELVIFDILTRPAPELSEAERAEVKKVAKVLLGRLKELLVLNWRQKSTARSQLKLAIEDVLDTLPQAYDRPLYAQKCSALFEHVYESYPERDAGVYNTAA